MRRRCRLGMCRHHRSLAVEKTGPTIATTIAVVAESGEAALSPRAPAVALCGCCGMPVPPCRTRSDQRRHSTPTEAQLAFKPQEWRLRRRFFNDLRKASSRGCAGDCQSVGAWHRCLVRLLHLRPASRRFRWFPRGCRRKSKYVLSSSSTIHSSSGKAVAARRLRERRHRPLLFPQQRR